MLLRSCRVAFLVVLASAPVSAAAQAACVANVDVPHFWTERGGFVQKAHVRAEVESARPGAVVRVSVGIRFHYERVDGWTNTLSDVGSVIIDTSDHRVETAVLDARAIACSEEAPCVVNAVEVVDVSCFQ